MNDFQTLNASGNTQISDCIAKFCAHIFKMADGQRKN